jgi:hypothetical protein
LKKRLTQRELRRYVRAQWDENGQPGKREFIETPSYIKKNITAFDELVMGDWFHFERMSDTEWWLRIGPRKFWIRNRGHGFAFIREILDA